MQEFSAKFNGYVALRMKRENSPADTVPSFQNGYVAPSSAKPSRSRKPRNTGPNYENLACVGGAHEGSLERPPEGAAHQISELRC